MLPHLQVLYLGTNHQFCYQLPPLHRFMLLPLPLQTWQVVHAQLSWVFPHFWQALYLGTSNLQFLQCQLSSTLPHLQALYLATSKLQFLQSHPMINKLLYSTSSEIKPNIFVDYPSKPLSGKSWTLINNTNQITVGSTDYLHRTQVVWYRAICKLTQARIYLQSNALP